MEEYFMSFNFFHKHTSENSYKKGLSVHFSRVKKMLPKRLSFRMMKYLVEHENTFSCNTIDFQTRERMQVSRNIYTRCELRHPCHVIKREIV